MVKNRLLATLLLLAAAVRLAYLVSIWNTPFLRVPIIDAKYYHEWALQLISRHSGDPGIFFMSPLYPYLLSIVYRLLAPLPQIVAILQLLAGLLLVYLIYRLGRQLGNETVGLIAASFAAFYRPFIYYEGVLLSALLILLLNAGALLLLVSNNHRLRKDFYAGLLLGLSALARPNVLLFVSLMALALVVYKGKGQVKRVVLLGAGVFLILLPVAYRNYRVGGEWVLTTAGLGMNFYAGNNPSAPGLYWEAPFLRSAEPKYENLDYQREAAQRLGKPLSLTAASRYWFGQGINFIVHQPGAFLQLLSRKLFLFFHQTEIPNNVSMYVAQDFSAVLRWVPLSFGLVAPLGFAYWVWWGRRRNWAVVNLYLLSYILAALLFFAASEYRLPILLILLIWAAAGLETLWNSLQHGRWPTVVKYLITALLLAIPINMRTPFASSLASPRMDYFNLGEVLQKQGRHQEAVPLFQRALIYDPYFVEAHKALGISYDALDLHQEAGIEFERANLDPHRELNILAAEDLFTQGQQKSSEGDYPSALRLFLDGCQIHPEPPVYALFNVAYLSVQTGDTTQALDYLDHAAEMDPAESRIPFLRGLINENRAEWRAALEQFTTAMKVNPDFSLARAHAAWVSLQSGQVRQAAELIEPLLGKRITDPDLEALVQQIARRVGY